MAFLGGVGDAGFQELKNDAEDAAQESSFAKTGALQALAETLAARNQAQAAAQGVSTLRDQTVAARDTTFTYRNDAQGFASRAETAAEGIEEVRDDAEAAVIAANDAKASATQSANAALAVQQQLGGLVDNIPLLVALPDRFTEVETEVEGQTSLIDYLQKLPYYLQQKDFLLSTASYTGTATNGAGLTISNRVISIGNGVTGQNTIIETPITIPSSWQVADRITFKVVLVESIENFIELKAIVNLAVTNSGVKSMARAFNFQTYLGTSGRVEVTFDYVILQGDTIVSPYLQINSTANNTGATRTIQFLETYTFNNLSPLRVLQQAIDNIPEVVQDAAGERMVTVRTLTGLRGIIASDAKSYFVSEKGNEGIFAVDTTDNSSADNGSTILISSNGKRLKLRQLKGVVSNTSYDYTTNPAYTPGTWINFLPVNGALEIETAYLITVKFTTHTIGGNLFLYRASGIIDSGQSSNSSGDSLPIYLNGAAHRIAGGITVDFRILFGSNAMPIFQLRVNNDNPAATGNVTIVTTIKKM